MNTKRIYTWGAFILIIGLIIWGMIAAANKAAKEEANIAAADQVTATDWTKGNASSTVTVVEYSDFQCPSCGQYFPLVEKIFNDYGTHYRFVYRHFPLQQHPNAVPASKASEAAGKQGKFWEMYQLLFTTQADWEGTKDAKAFFLGYAKKLNLDTEKFSTDFDSPEAAKKIDDDYKSGIRAGVNSTPSFYINGKKIVSPQSYDEFKNLIDAAATTTTNF